MLHLEVEVLEGKEPASHPGIHILCPGHPLQQSMVSHHSKALSLRVTPQFQNCPLGSQDLFFRCGILGFGRSKLLANVHNRVFFSVLNLGQDSFQPRVRNATVWSVKGQFKSGG